MAASLLVVFVVYLSSIVSGNEFKRIDQCGRHTKLKNPYSTGQAYSNIECTDQCLADDSCVAVTSCAQDKTRSRSCEKSNDLTGLYDCNNHEIDDKCSTWKKINPCRNGAPLINNTCVCSYNYDGVTCEHDFYPVSCSDIRRKYWRKNQSAASKTYTLYTTSKKPVEVFCEFKNESFGVMYIPKSSLKELQDSGITELVPKNNKFMLRQKLNNLEEKESLVTMLPKPGYENLNWSVMSPVNLALFDGPGFNMGSYIYVGAVPKTEMQHYTYFGFGINGGYFENICSSSSNPNYFAFYSNASAQTGSFANICQNLQDNVITKCTHKLPSNDFFYFPLFEFKCVMRCLHQFFKDLIGFTPGFLFDIDGARLRKQPLSWTRVRRRDAILNSCQNCIENGGDYVEKNGAHVTCIQG